MDLWSINHLLFGVIAGSLFAWIKLEFWPSFLITSALVLAWEVFEMWHESISEHIQNISVDIVLGIGGFLIIYYILHTFNVLHVSKYIFIASSLISIILAIIGYINFVARTPGEKHPIPLPTSLDVEERDTIDI